MKRDMDLIRRILFKTEELPFHGRGMSHDLSIEGYDDATVSYHIMLLDEAGLIAALKPHKQAGWQPVRLTWNGHEFLEAIKDETRWKQVKSAMKPLGGFVFEVSKMLVLDLMKRQVGLP